MALPWPPNWDTLFGRPAPLVVEVGFGNGYFLADLALHHPGLNVVGIERAHSPMTWTESRVQRKKLENVRLVFGEALMSLRCLFPPNSVEAFHINFSDPWPKKKHHKRRLITQEFLETVASRLKPGGNLYIATDILQYAGEIGLALSSTPGLKNAYPSPWMVEREDTRIRTWYERQAIAAGRSSHYFKWRRTESAVLHPLIPQEEVMPNARLHLPYPIETAAEQFQPMTVIHGDRVVNVARVYQQYGKPHLMFETYIEEALFNQRLALTLETRPNETLLNLGHLGYPRATRGVHDAAALLMGWLISLHPEARIIEHTILVPED
jgi:tRNA (guanine-N7-)-methyltransferase